MSGTLPSSGVISGSQIASVWETAATNISLDGLANTASITIGDSIVSMSQFYGTGPQEDYQEYYYYNVGSKFSSTACSNQTNDVMYYSGSGTTPQAGDHLFDNEDPSLASPLNLTGGQWYAIAADVNTSPILAMQISLFDDNEIDVIGLCPPS